VVARGGEGGAGASARDGNLQCGPADVQPFVLSPKAWTCMPRSALASLPVRFQEMVVWPDSFSCSKVTVPLTLESPRTTATVDFMSAEVSSADGVLLRRCHLLACSSRAGGVRAGQHGSAMAGRDWRPAIAGRHRSRFRSSPGTLRDSARQHSPQNRTWRSNRPHYFPCIATPSVHSRKSERMCSIARSLAPRIFLKQTSSVRKRQWDLPALTIVTVLMA